MPKKYLGQHFLSDPRILGRIIRAAGIRSDDTVVEIGPGPGILTRLLSAHAGRVIAIELDSELCKALRRQFPDRGHVEIIQGDALAYPYEQIGHFKVVANIPYYITTPIIFRLLDAKPHLESMTLTVQKEVAERIVAEPGGKEYGILSIMVQYHAEAEIKFLISRDAFRPAPKVDSAVLHVTIRDRPAVEISDRDLFFRIVRTSFAQRRKTLANSLRPVSGHIRDALLQAGIDPGRRPETLSLADFARLADILKQ